jgi:two-component system response regulator VanR
MAYKLLFIMQRQLDIVEKYKKILIVEPDSKYTLKLFLLFSDEDYKLEISRSFTEAVEKIRNIKFDCVIMDVNLPEMKGYDAVSIMKLIDPGIEIIMTADNNTMELEAEIRKHDIFYYYIKSFDDLELKLAVHDVFRKSGKIS